MRSVVLRGRCLNHDRCRKLPPDVLRRPGSGLLTISTRLLRKRYRNVRGTPTLGRSRSRSATPTSNSDCGCATMAGGSIRKCSHHQSTCRVEPSVHEGELKSEAATLAWSTSNRGRGHAARSGEVVGVGQVTGENADRPVPTGSKRDIRVDETMRALPFDWVVESCEIDRALHEASSHSDNAPAAPSWL